MFIDASAIIAVLAQDPGWKAFADLGDKKPARQSRHRRFGRVGGGERLSRIKNIQRRRPKNACKDFYTFPAFKRPAAPPQGQRATASH